MWVAGRAVFGVLTALPGFYDDRVWRETSPGPKKMVGWLGRTRPRQAGQDRCRPCIVQHTCPTKRPALFITKTRVFANQNISRFLLLFNGVRSLLYYTVMGISSTAFWRPDMPLAQYARSTPGLVTSRPSWLCLLRSETHRNRTVQPSVAPSKDRLTRKGREKAVVGVNARTSAEGFLAIDLPDHGWTGIAPCVAYVFCQI